MYGAAVESPQPPIIVGGLPAAGRCHSPTPACSAKWTKQKQQHIQRRLKDCVYAASWSWVVAVVPALVAGGLLGALYLREGGLKAPGSLATAPDGGVAALIPGGSDARTSTSYALSASAENEYTASYGAPGKKYPWVSNYAGIVEPHRTTTLIASCDSCPNASTSYLWTLTDVGGHTDLTLSGASVEHTFTQLVTYPVTLEAFDGSNSGASGAQTSLGTWQGEFVCRCAPRTCDPSPVRRAWPHTMPRRARAKGTFDARSGS